MKRPRWLREARAGRGSRAPECGGEVQQTYCEVCGYDLVLKTRGDNALRRPPMS